MPQDMGYNVDVLVTASNACKSKSQLMNVASGLRVSLKMEQLNFHRVVVEGIHIRVRPRGRAGDAPAAANAHGAVARFWVLPSGAARMCRGLLAWL